MKHVNRSIYTKDNQVTYLLHSCDGYVEMDCNRCSSLFLIVAYALLAMFAYLSNVKGGDICKPSIDLTLEIVVKVKPCLSVIPISMVALCKVKPCDLCMVRAQAIRNGICLRFPLAIGVIGTILGYLMSHGKPL